MVHIIPSHAATRDLKFLIKMVLVVSAILISPIVIFPAFAQEVNLAGGTNFCWLGLLAVAFAAFASRQLIDAVLATAVNRWPVKTTGQIPVAKFQSRMQLAMTIALSASVVVLLKVESDRAIARTRAVVSDVHARYADNTKIQLEGLREFASAPFMTNINVPTVYFYTRSVGLGVCGLDSVAEDGSLDSAACKIALIRNRERYANFRPSYFILFKTSPYFPGFADCGPPGLLVADEQKLRAPRNCLAIQKSRLDKNFSEVMETPLFDVYDLKRGNAVDSKR